MTIQIGDRIPEVNIKRINGGIDTIDTHTFFEGKRRPARKNICPASSNTSKRSAPKALASPACR
jgi:hypothetical protein